MEFKLCGGKNGCGVLKPINQFHRRKESKDGRRKACKQCELSLKKEYWDTMDGAKKAAKLSYMSNYYASHKEEASAYNKEKYPEVRLEKIANAKKWAEDNPVRKKEIASKWQQSNHAKCAAKTAKYRNSKLLRTPSWVLQDPDELWLIEQFYIRAAELTAITGMEHQVDHIYPLQGDTVSGFHCWQNLQILTRYENARKGNTMPTLKENTNE